MKMNKLPKVIGITNGALIGLMAVVGFTTTPAMAQKAKDMLEAGKYETIKVCFEGAYPPFSSISPAGDVVGFDPDIANALVTAMGRKIQPVKVDWDGIIPALLAKKCDAIIAQMSITEERKKKIDFTDKYTGSAPMRFVGKKSANLSDSESFLAKKNVGIQRGTVAEEFIKKHYPKVKYKSYATQDEGLADLVSGRLDAFAADEISFYDFTRGKYANDFGFFGKPHKDDAVLGIGAGIGVRKEDTRLRDAFSQAIKDIRKSGEYKKINNKYFDHDIY